MSLNSNPSEWVTGESDPKDFTAEAVVEVVNSRRSADEVQRIKDADERESVQSAADSKLESLNSGDNSGDNSGNGSGDSGNATQTAPNYTPSPDAAGPATPAEESKWADDAGVDDDYDPYQDPDVPSSFVAGQVAIELESGESPTLNAIKEGKKDDESDDDE